MEKVYLVTGNSKKVDIAQSALSKYDIAVEQINVDTPEIQSDSVEEVAKASARYASEKTGKAVLKGDFGMSIAAMNGFPGPFVKYINRWFSPKQFANIFYQEENRKACLIDVLAYCEPGKEPVCFISNSYGHLIDKPRGGNGNMIDSFFIPVGHDKTLAEFSKEESIEYWSNDRYDKFGEFLKKAAHER
jgi:XTP/dITP diphosphohydrolase